MRIILSIMLSSFLLFGQALAAEQQEEKHDTKSQKDKLSYSLGYDIGRRMKTSSVDIDSEVYIRAFRDGFAGNKAAMTDQEMLDTLQSLRKEMTPKQPDKRKAVTEKKELAANNKKEGEVFLAENVKKEGVVTLPSGLPYKIMKEGTGKQPAKTDKVKVQYRGTLINGTEFDSSYKRGEPAMLGVDKVIKGWTEALLLMKEGSKWMLYVPSNLAYGARGAARGVIGPNQTLIFEVELISVQQ